MISVVMGIHRFDDFVEPAIKSILEQTFTDFELIIVANGSEADSVVRSIKSIFPNEMRVKYLKVQIGQLAYALNVGIDAAKYDYIARMDSDDIAYPERLKEQFLFIRKNGLDLVGTSVDLINENGEVIGYRKGIVKNKISKKLPFSSPFVHPSVMFKKSILIKGRGYNSGFNSEDYDLWLRLNRLGVNWDNISIPLLKYRVHSQASQGRLLGYAEVSGYSVREFLLNKTFINFFAAIVNFLKAIIKPDRSKDRH